MLCVTWGLLGQVSSVNCEMLYGTSRSVHSGKGKKSHLSSSCHGCSHHLDSAGVSAFTSSISLTVQCSDTKLAQSIIGRGGLKKKVEQKKHPAKQCVCC